jgi:acetoacetate decarboxylase
MSIENKHGSALKGYAVPLTPQGKSTLVPPPPWHYSSDCLVVEYWADPAAVAALLPPGMTADEAAGGRAFFWFLDWQFTGSNDELTDPARYQYREAFVLIEAIYEGTPVTYCPYIFVDNDSAIARGWTQGFPKKLGSIFQTRTFAAPSAAAAPLAPGSRFGASVAAHGERLATARIQIEEAIADPTTVFNRPTTIRRYFPQLVAGAQDRPAVDELTLSLTDNPAIVNLWSGSAELTIPEVAGEDMHAIAPVRVGRGFKLSMSYSVTDLRILENYLA